MIFLDNRQNLVKITEELEYSIKEVIEHALREEKVNLPCEVSIIFVDNDCIRDINSENRNIDKITDVLSFPMLEYPPGKVFKDVYMDYEFQPEDMDGGKLILGDIAISLEKAEEQSREFGHSFLREVCYLTVHSLLHLLGYDHMKDEDKKIMRSREEEILQKFKL
ncbi:rRNA maturation RNase YbeY [Clostridium luticellarii]|uniref:Endoribonuclease YbeY n=1 Tax=Clostridium luticellarii TaxID=1691940 RepID=A0A2T0BLZ1_9CLOT|nr:rRNA maturation RNase YbeY [Clostridium luticellarii]PRR84905.1 Endoribonuclease YbeY [Clostridium luticellarii]